MELRIGVHTKIISGMSGFKSKKICGVLLIVCIVLGSCILSYYSYNRHIKGKEPIESIHSISLYTTEGDTILDLDTNSDWVKVWIGDSCEVDVWTINEEGGWTRK